MRYASRRVGPGRRSALRWPARRPGVNPSLPCISPCIRRGRHVSAGGGPVRPPARNGSADPDWARSGPDSPGTGFSAQGPFRSRCRRKNRQVLSFRMQATALTTESESIWRANSSSPSYVGRSFLIKADSSALIFFFTDSLSFWSKENTMSLDLRIRRLKSTNERLLSPLHFFLFPHFFSSQFSLHQLIRKLPPVSRGP